MNYAYQVTSFSGTSPTGAKQTMYQVSEPYEGYDHIMIHVLPQMVYATGCTPEGDYRIAVQSAETQAGFQVSNIPNEVILYKLGYKLMTPGNGGN